MLSRDPERKMPAPKYGERKYSSGHISPEDGADYSPHTRTHTYIYIYLTQSFRNI